MQRLELVHLHSNKLEGTMPELDAPNNLQDDPALSPTAVFPWTLKTLLPVRPLQFAVSSGHLCCVSSVGCVSETLFSNFLDN